MKDMLDKIVQIDGGSTEYSIFIGTVLFIEDVETGDLRKFVAE